MNSTFNAFIKFLKEWTLPTSMGIGAAAYFLWQLIPGHDAWRHQVSAVIGVVQPTLLFCMLFLSFCNVRIKEFTLRWWYLWLAMFQLGMFGLLATVACLDIAFHLKVIAESAMLCFLCPTATAAAVVTNRLGGSQAAVVSYTIIINLLVSLAAPLVLPHVYTASGITFIEALLDILRKVFPLLIGPLVTACAVRQLLPRLHARIIKLKNLAFYLWAVSLALAIAVSAQALMNTTVDIWCQLGIGGVTLLACLAQFAFGKHVGQFEGDRLTAGQACGQKNTVFAIWLGFTFLHPVTAIAGGFYSIYHNVINSIQLYHYEHRKPNS